MRKIRITFICCFIILLTACFIGCEINKTEYLRIHIRANSNDSIDQSVKYEIRDIVVSYLTPIVSKCLSKAEAVEKVEKEKNAVKALIDRHLAKKGFNYHCKVSIKNEEFPSRVYEGVTLKSGYYDALIIELGDASGDNWWCVVYPPLCFMGNEDIEYRSKIFDLINGL